MPVSKLKLEPEIPKNGKIADILTVGQWVAVQVAKEPISTKRTPLDFRTEYCRTESGIDAFADKVSVSQK